MPRNALIHPSSTFKIQLLTKGNPLTKDLTGKILESRASKSSTKGLFVKSIAVHTFVSLFLCNFYFMPQMHTAVGPDWVNMTIKKKRIRQGPVISLYSEIHEDDNDLIPFILETKYDPRA